MSCFYNKEWDFIKWTNVPCGRVVKSALKPPESKLDYSEEFSFPVNFNVFQNNTAKNNFMNF